MPFRKEEEGLIRERGNTCEGWAREHGEKKGNITFSKKVQRLLHNGKLLKNARKKREGQIRKEKRLG